MAHTVRFPSWEQKEHFDDNIRSEVAWEIVKG